MPNFLHTKEEARIVAKEIAQTVTCVGCGDPAQPGYTRCSYCQRSANERNYPKGHALRGLERPMSAQERREKDLRDSEVNRRMGVDNAYEQARRGVALTKELNRLDRRGEGEDL
jgi:hypothetical protein